MDAEVRWGKLGLFGRHLASFGSYSIDREIIIVEILVWVFKNFILYSRPLQLKTTLELYINSEHFSASYADEFPVTEEEMTFRGKSPREAVVLVS